MTRGRERLRVLLVGVGGQGVLTAAQVLGNAASAASLDVMVGQLHGMSQRGGSVEATVLFGPGRSAFVGAGEADVVVGFEPLETLRAVPRMDPRTTRVLLSTGRIAPFALAQQGGAYPPLDDVVGQIREACAELRVVDGPALAGRAGDARTLNIVLLGALGRMDAIPVDGASVLRAVEQRYAPRHRAVNRRAFECGRGAVVQPADGRTP